MKKASTKPVKKRTKFRKSIPLLIMFLPVILYFAVFKYAPMFGLVMAFEDYRLADGVFGSAWVGMRNFKLIFSSPIIGRVILNTVRIGTLSYLVGFPMPILLALFINEIYSMTYKKTVQTLVYLPHFLSWVAVGGIVVTVFAQSNGIVNNVIRLFGGEPIPFLYRDSSWLAVYLGTGIWKEMGFAAIIYLAALGGIDQELYEAAAIDGCGRWKKMFYISLPSIIPAIMVNLILNAGSVLNVGFDQVSNLSNDAVRGISNVISTWSYDTGLKQLQFSMSTAVGLFNSLISFVLVFSANRIAKIFKSNLW